MRPPRRRTTKLTATELAELKGCSTQAVRQAIGRGLLPAVKKGKTWLIAPQDAEAWQPRNWGPGKLKERG